MSLEALTPEQKEDVVNISLSTYNLDNVNIREAIIERYDAEIIGKDLIIKVSFVIAYTPQYVYRLLIFINFHRYIYTVKVDITDSRYNGH